MNVQGVIDVITEQRNSALNELALCKADLAEAKKTIATLSIKPESDQLKFDRQEARL